jgi:hypothetical protein
VYRVKAHGRPHEEGLALRAANWHMRRTRGNFCNVVATGCVLQAKAVTSVSDRTGDDLEGPSLHVLG